MSDFWALLVCVDETGGPGAPVLVSMSDILALLVGVDETGGSGVHCSTDVDFVECKGEIVGYLPEASRTFVAVGGSQRDHGEQEKAARGKVSFDLVVSVHIAW